MEKSKKTSGRKTFWLHILHLLIAVLAFLALSLALKLLWNAVMPSLIEAKDLSIAHLDFAHAAGLLLLSRLLFGRLLPHFGHRGRAHGGMHGPRSRSAWKAEWHQRMHEIYGQDPHKHRSHHREHHRAHPDQGHHTHGHEGHHEHGHHEHGHHEHGHHHKCHHHSHEKGHHEHGHHKHGHPNKEELANTQEPDKNEASTENS